MSKNIISTKTYLYVFGALLVLLILTVGVSFLKLGPFNPVIALTIAILKAVLIILFFMHVMHSSRLVWVLVMAGFFWLMIMIGLTMSDYLTRGLMR